MPIEQLLSEQKAFGVPPLLPQYLESDKVYEQLFGDFFSKDITANPKWTYNPAYQFYGAYDLSKDWFFTSSSLPEAGPMTAYTDAQTFQKEFQKKYKDRADYYNSLLQIDRPFYHVVDYSKSRSQELSDRESLKSFFEWTAMITGVGALRPALQTLLTNAAVYSGAAAFLLDKVKTDYPKLDGLIRQDVANIVAQYSFNGVYQNPEDFFAKEDILKKLEERAENPDIPEEGRALYKALAASIAKNAFENSLGSDGKIDAGQMAAKIKENTTATQGDLSSELQDNGDQLAGTFNKQFKDLVAQDKDNLIDALKKIQTEIKEAQKRQDHEEVKAILGVASQSSALLTGVLSLFDGKHAEEYGKVNQALQVACQAGSAINDIVNGALQGAAVFGPYVALGMAALNIISLFKNKSGPSADEIILQTLKAISEQIADLRQHIDDRFDRIEQILGAQYTSFMIEFGKLHMGQVVISAKLDEISKQLDDIQRRLDEFKLLLERSNAKADENQASLQLEDLREVVLHHILSPAYDNYPEERKLDEIYAAYKTLKTMLELKSKSRDLAGRAEEPFNQVLDKAMVFGADYYINAFAARAGFEPSQRLVNPLVWDQSLGYWIDFEERYADLAAQFTEIHEVPSLVETIEQDMDNVSSFISYLQKSPNFFDSLISNYTAKLNNVFDLLNQRKMEIALQQFKIKLARAQVNAVMENCTALEKAGESQVARDLKVRIQSLATQLFEISTEHPYEVDKTKLNEVHKVIQEIVFSMPVAVRVNKGAFTTDFDQIRQKSPSSYFPLGNGNLQNVDFLYDLFLQKYPDFVVIDGFYRSIPDTLWGMVALDKSNFSPSLRLFTKSTDFRNQRFSLTFSPPPGQPQGNPVPYTIEAPYFTDIEFIDINVSGSQPFSFTLGGNALNLFQGGDQRADYRSPKYKGSFDYSGETSWNGLSLEYNPGFGTLAKYKPFDFEADYFSDSGTCDTSNLFSDRPRFLSSSLPYPPDDSYLNLPALRDYYDYYQQYEKQYRVVGAANNSAFSCDIEVGKEMLEKVAETSVLDELADSENTELKSRLAAALEELEDSRNEIELYTRLAVNESYVMDPEFRSYFIGGHQLWDKDAMEAIFIDRLTHNDNELVFDFATRKRFADERVRDFQASLHDKLSKIQTGELKESYFPLAEATERWAQYKDQHN